MCLRRRGYDACNKTLLDTQFTNLRGEDIGLPFGSDWLPSSCFNDHCGNGLLVRVDASVTYHVVPLISSIPWQNRYRRPLELTK